MRVLITGGGGQLATDLGVVCSAAGDEVAAPLRAALDVTDRDAVLGTITSWRPDAVLHTAAWTAVDACEGDPRRAFTDNAVAVRWIAEGCARAGAHLVHLSTDYVFDGELDRPYTEWDRPAPRSVYGASKLAGETEALALGTGAAVVRSSWICGQHGTNMVKTILRLIGEHRELQFVDDQVGSPTFTTDLAPLLRRVAIDRRSGVLHATNAGSTSWFGFAQDVVTAAGRSPEMVRPIATADLRPARPAPRPANSRLDNAVLAASGLAPLRHYREALEETVDALQRS